MTFITQFDLDYRQFAAQKRRERKPIRSARVDLCPECDAALSPFDRLAFDPETKTACHVRCWRLRQERAERAVVARAGADVDYLREVAAEKRLERLVRAVQQNPPASRRAAADARALADHGSTEAGARMLRAWAEQLDARGNS